MSWETMVVPLSEPGSTLASPSFVGWPVVALVSAVCATILAVVAMRIQDLRRQREDQDLADMHEQAIAERQQMRKVDKKEVPDRIATVQRNLAPSEALERLIEQFPNRSEPSPPSGTVQNGFGGREPLFLAAPNDSDQTLQTIQEPSNRFGDPFGIPKRLLYPHGHSDLNPSDAANAEPSDEANLRCWAKETLIKKPGNQLQSTDIYRLYMDWCRKRDVIVLTQTAFGRAMRRIGYSKGRDNKTRRMVYLHVTLKRPHLQLVKA
jgi:hypothetical protein